MSRYGLCESEEHYSETITKLLIAKGGWKRNGKSFEKTFKNVQLAGEVGDGSLTLTAEWIEPGMRWFAVYRGFKTLIEMDGREYWNDPAKFVKELDKKIKIALAKSK